MEKTVLDATKLLGVLDEIGVNLTHFMDEKDMAEVKFYSSKVLDVFPVDKIERKHILLSLIGVLSSFIMATAVEKEVRNDRIQTP